tara:strand:+ start:23658 stop:25706 length:2049 start_codon:yes stop_codon:yes gene_type:complete
MDSEPKKHSNSLIKQTSPYLLQHAYNPVNWISWEDNILDYTKKQNKLLIISIGYSTCHWCHVMEKEVFENKEAAKYMNKNFISIKIDREERPEVDHLYMEALQIISGRGGWPLNIVALPNGAPIWGSTYVNIDNWNATLKKLVELYNKKPKTAFEYGVQIQKIIEKQKSSTKKEEVKIDINKVLNTAEESFDYENGGFRGHVKFMMPVQLRCWQFLSLTNKNNLKLQQFWLLTLHKISMGGVFDFVGGGFSRYSTDERWHIPHFEKMGYDNGQLLQVFSEAFKSNNLSHFRRTAKLTLQFILRELKNENGAFYTALDADSISKKFNLKEGAFYVWNEEEIKNILKEDYSLFIKFLNDNNSSYWPEEKKLVLFRTRTEEEFCDKNNLNLKDFILKTNNWRTLLYANREKRIKPFRDEKIICSWNAIIAKGLLSSYQTFGWQESKDAAEINIDFILSKFLLEDNKLLRIYQKEENKIYGVLEDYASVISLLIMAFETLHKKKYIETAYRLIDYCLLNFYDTNLHYFYFSSRENKSLWSKKIDVEDNVIPSSNALMAENLSFISQHLNRDDLKSISLKMIKNMTKKVKMFPGNYSQWLQLIALNKIPQYQIAIIGNNAFELSKKLNKIYLPNCRISASQSKSDLPLFKNRFKTNQTLFYVCEDSRCNLPVKTIEEVIKQIKFSVL